MNITLSKILKIAFILSIVAAVLLIMYTFSHIVITLAIAILIGLILEPAVSYLERRNINRSISILFMFAVFGFIVYLMLSIFIPKMIYQFNALSGSMQNYSFRETFQQWEENLIEHVPFFKEGVLLSKFEYFVTEAVENTVSLIAQVISDFFSIITIVVILPFATFFILRDKNKLIGFVVNLFPNKYFEISYWIIKKVMQQLGRYVRGWIADATFTGVAVGLGFYAFGFEYSFILGIIAGVGNLVPYLGPYIAGIPALLVSVAQFGDLSGLPVIIVVILTVYALDNGFVLPYVYSKSVDMHPLAVALLILAGSQTFGILGMLLAVPLATVVQTVVVEVVYAIKNYTIIREKPKEIYSFKNQS